MVHVIGAQNAHLYQSEMEDAFRLRHRIFVDERKWLALKKPDKREIDQFGVYSELGKEGRVARLNGAEPFDSYLSALQKDR